MKIVAIATLMLALTGGVALAQGDLADGEAQFKKCTSCHSVGEGATNKMGPVLNGVVGRTAATYEGFPYSTAMKEAGAGGLVWTPETLDQFLTKPRDMIPGTKMAFGGISDETQRTNLIAYLVSLSPDYVPAEAGAEAAEAPTETPAQ